MKDYGRLGLFLRLAPFAVLAVGLMATWLIRGVVQQHALEELRGEFGDEVRIVDDRINERLDDYRDILNGAAGLFAASRSVERQEFYEYVNSLHLEQIYPGIQGVGFALRIPARDRAHRIEAIRREGFPQFSIWPDGARDPYSAIIYLEPLDWRNRRALGFDMYAEPTRREAMERACDDGSAALSGKVVLVQETGADVQSGFLMYVPVYRNNLPHQTVEERRRNLVGWVYEPFRMNDLMKKGVLGKYLDTVSGKLDVEIYDGDRLDAKNIMFDSALARPGTRAQFVSVQSLRHFGRSWTIVIRSLPAFEATLKIAQAQTVAIGGVLISVLLAWAVWLLATTDIRAMKHAEKLSEKVARTLTEAISAMATVIEMRDPYTAGHQKRAAELACAIAKEMGVRGEQFQALNLAALTYEIGKIQIPAEILSKPGRLDDIEYGLIKVHAQAGFEILRGIDFPWPIAQIVQQHHERLNGSGYPQGLKGDEIRLEARIIAVADVVEAMVSHRPYRIALGEDDALAEITSNRGVLYDSAVVDACVRLFQERRFNFSS